MPSLLPSLRHTLNAQTSDVERASLSMKSSFDSVERRAKRERVEEVLVSSRLAFIHRRKTYTLSAGPVRSFSASPSYGTGSEQSGAQSSGSSSSASYSERP